MKRLLVAVALLAGAATAFAQGFRFGLGRASVEPVIDNAPYDGRFMFARLKYTPAPGGYYYRGLPAWAHGYVPVPGGSRAEQNLTKIMKEISPAQHVSEKCAPTLLIHGDIDLLVPLQQSKLMVEKLKEKNVPSELVVHKGGGHGWTGIEKDVTKIADWFDKYLAKK